MFSYNMLVVVTVALLSGIVIVTGWKSPGGVYLHIPFCRRRCYYCDFPIKVVGDGRSSQNTATSAYTDIISREITAAAVEIDRDETQLETVYFGGGTPSLLQPHEVGKILDSLDDRIGAISSAEITLEMDPGTFNRETAIAFAKSGVNRVSLGVQSFDNTVLEGCGRAHRVEDVYRAFDDLHAAGIDNISVDLISSLPHVSEELWRKTLLAAVSTSCPHISVYDLQIEEGTAFGRWYSPGVFPLPSNERSAAMYSLAVSTLTEISNFEHYEVSNYAKAGFRSNHNQRYWRCDPTWGFGMGAASYIRGERVTRPTSLQAYEEWVDGIAGPDGAGLPYTQAVRTLIPPQEEADDGDDDEDAGMEYPNNKDSTDDDALEVIMLALRTSDGLHLPSLSTRYGSPIARKVLRGLEEYIEKGLVVPCYTEGDADGQDLSAAAYTDPLNGHPWAVSHVRLKDPEGFLLSNDIIASVFAEFLD